MFGRLSVPSQRLTGTAQYFKTLLKISWAKANRGWEEENGTDGNSVRAHGLYQLRETLQKVDALYVFSQLLFFYGLYLLPFVILIHICINLSFPITAMILLQDPTIQTNIMRIYQYYI